MSVKLVAQNGNRPIRILQYGKGNFPRTFADYMIAAVKPLRAGNPGAFKRQKNQYTVCLRGRQSGRTVSESRRITCIGKAADPYGEYENCMALAEPPPLGFLPSDTTEVSAAGPIPRGHKAALKRIQKGAPVVKYGTGTAARNIRPGEWVHRLPPAGKGAPLCL